MFTYNAAPLVLRILYVLLLRTMHVFYNLFCVSFTI